MVLDLIKKTNGDLLGVVLFIFIIIYFIQIENRNTFESIILYSSIGALFVDTHTVLNALD